MRRRHVVWAALAAGAASVAAAPGRAAAMTGRRLAAPGAVAQIAAGGPTGLLAVGADGTLFALPPDGAAARRLGGGIDPATPLAVGHGRIAARRADGALWVLEGGRVGVSGERALAPAAGLLVLALAVIGIEADGPRHRAVRLEPAGDGAWRRVARSAVEVLPDARPLQADLDGHGDGGQVVLLAGPDAGRYRHGVLGDAIEATRMVLLERHGLEVLRELVLDAPFVFEDIAPRRVAIGTSRDGLLSVRSGPQGGQLVLVDADPAARGALRLAASGPPLGTANRWMAPTTDGRHWLAVHTPHLGGVLHAYRREGERLVARRLADGVSNHRIGARDLDVSAWQGTRLWIAIQSGRGLRVLDTAADARLVAEHMLPARALALVALQSPASVAALLDDGAVLVFDAA